MLEIDPNHIWSFCTFIFNQCGYWVQNSINYYFGIYIGRIDEHQNVKIIYIYIYIFVREMLIDALRAIINSPFKENFNRKRKKKQFIF